MLAIQVFCLLSVLLLAGKILRSKFSVLQKLYLPSSVVAGLLGLIIVSIFSDLLPAEWLNTIKKLPGFLINVIFATLFLGAVTPKFKHIIRLALPQLCLGQILGWGQYVVGLALTGFLLTRFFDVPPAFGNLLEIGFHTKG